MSKKISGEAGSRSHCCDAPLPLPAAHRIELNVAPGCRGVNAPLVCEDAPEGNSPGQRLVLRVTRRNGSRVVQPRHDASKESRRVLRRRFAHEVMLEVTARRGNAMDYRRNRPVSEIPPEMLSEDGTRVIVKLDSPEPDIEGKNLADVERQLALAGERARAGDFAGAERALSERSASAQRVMPENSPRAAPPLEKDVVDAVSPCEPFLLSSGQPCERRRSPRVMKPLLKRQDFSRAGGPGYRFPKCRGESRRHPRRRRRGRRGHWRARRGAGCRGS